MCVRSSVVRSFRYVATLTAQQVVTSLVAAQLLLGEARETAQRQLDAEKSKKGSKAGLQAHDHSLDSLDGCKKQAWSAFYGLHSFPCHQFGIRDLAPGAGQGPHTYSLLVSVSENGVRLLACP